MNRWLTYAVGLMIASLLIGGSFRARSDTRPPRAAVGYPAPDFHLTDVDGQPMKLSDYRGQPVLLNFWATWCPPCNAEMPEIQKLRQQVPDLVILGVDLGSSEKSPQAVAAYMKSRGYSWHVPFDADGAVNEAYGVISVPTSFFIARDGVIRTKYVGPMSLPQLSDHASIVLGR